MTLKCIIIDDEPLARKGLREYIADVNFLELVAEFDNFRRRSAKERIELIQTAGREVLSDMLDVMDDAAVFHGDK